MAAGAIRGISRNRRQLPKPQHDLPGPNIGTEVQLLVHYFFRLFSSYYRNTLNGVVIFLDKAQRQTQDRAVADILFITHPDVVVDPTIPVPNWSLSARGRQRMAAFAGRPIAGHIQSIACSEERKAVDAAEILGERRQLTPIRFADLGENDRSATGFLPSEEFEATADLFFANPTNSVRGWERAIDAQRRIIAVIDRIRACAPADPSTTIAVIAHGAVGALLLCRLTNVPIDRKWDQPGSSGGHYFRFACSDLGLRHGWRPIDPALSGHGNDG
jgi:broad specificity phosphatase PhoE